MTAKGKYGGRKVRDGTVVSDKMAKTLLVAVEEHIRHPLYKKRVRRLRRFMAHDERDEGKLGDRVRIVEAAPISRKKRWKLVEILQRAELPDVAPESIDLDLLGEVKREEGAVAETVAAPAATDEAAETGEAAAADAPAPEEASEPEAEETTPEVEAEETPEAAVTDEVEAVEEAAEEAEAGEASGGEAEAVDVPADEAEAVVALVDEAEAEGAKN